MEQLLEAIRAATAADATPEARATGATACRTILIALDAKEGEILGAPAPIPAMQTPNVAAMVAGLKGVPVEQLLDLAIARIKAALPAGSAVQPVQPLNFHILPLPKLGGRT